MFRCIWGFSSLWPSGACSASVFLIVTAWKVWDWKWGCKMQCICADVNEEQQNHGSIALCGLVYHE